MLSKFGNLSVRENSTVTSAYVRPPACPYKLWGRGRGVPRQPNSGWKMSFFLGEKSCTAFGQPAFFLAGNRMTTVTSEKRFFLKSLAYLAKRFSLTEVKFSFPPPPLGFRYVTIFGKGFTFSRKPAISFTI